MKLARVTEAGRVNTGETFYEESDIF